VIERPARALALGAKKLLLFANAIELANRDRYYFARRYSPLLQLPLPSFGLIASLGLAGAAFAWRRRPRTALVYAFLAVQVASYVIVFVLARYRIVAAAALCLSPVARRRGVDGQGGAGALGGVGRGARRRRRGPRPVGLAAARFASAHWDTYLQRGGTGRRGRAGTRARARRLGRPDWTHAAAFRHASSSRRRTEEKERGKAMLRDLVTELGDASPEHAKLRRSAERQLHRLEFRRTPTPDDEPDLEPSFD
jgi:hypothetical protein